MMRPTRNWEGLRSHTLQATMTLQSMPPVPASLAVALRELANLERVAGVAVTVVRDGQTIGFWSAGHASLPFRVPITEGTLFHLGSVGKHITALAVMQLVDAGAVALDAPLGSYVRDLPESWAAAPVRCLLTHTSGLPDYGWVIKDWDRPQGREMILKAIGEVPPLFGPGEAWTYSNTNYLVLGWLIETVSGQAYPDYVRDRLFEPARLPTARVDSAEDVIPARAEPYEYSGGRFTHAVQIEKSVSAAADGGALFSAGDVAPWSLALSGDRLVSRALLSEAWTPALLSTGRQVPYGFGWFVERTAGQDMHWHAGRVPGFSAVLVHLAGASLWVAVMTNATPPPPMLLMALTAAEAFVPGSTFLTLPAAGDGRDPETERLLQMLGRGGAPLNLEWLAPEMQMTLRASGAGSLATLPPDVRVEPIESYPVGGGRMVRYRATLGTNSAHYLIGWTDDDRMFWMS